MRLGWALGGLALVAAIGGCSSDEPPPQAPAGSASAPAFEEPASYRYVLTRGCDQGQPLGRYRVTVRDGAVSKSDRLDAAETAPSGDVDLGPVTGEGEEIEVPTLGELLDMAQTASDDGGEVSRTLDVRDGHPVQVMIKVSEAPECFGISDYAAGG